MMTLNKLYLLIKSRRKKLPANSYTTSLLKAGSDSILKKVAEETAEVIIASKNNQKSEIINEVSDLYYHILVLLVVKDINLNDVFYELDRRSKSENKI